MYIPSHPEGVKGALQFVAALGRVLLVAVFAAVLLIPAAAPAVLANSGPSDAEAHALNLINAERGRMGRAPLHWDSRVSDIAQWRSDVQASKNQMLHDLQGVVSRFNQQNIAWYDIGEALLHGTPRTPMESAEEAVRWWRGSKAHWDLLSSTGHDYNYIALGMTRARDGWYYWTAIVFDGPDRTPPKASMTNANTGKMVNGSRSVTVSWTGRDVQLFSHTAGLKDFKLQSRVGSGNWVTVTDWTTATSKTFQLDTGRTYSFRVKARDDRGNRSGWSDPLSVSP